MKKAVLIRHAKSDWNISGLQDIDRPLNQRGYTDAHKTGAHLRDKISGKIFFVSSPAIRAMSTALIIAREINYPTKKILIDSKLYEAEVEAYEDVIQFTEDIFDVVFIFGHNPTISNVIGVLTGTTVGEAPTCAVTILNFQTQSWAEALHLKATVEMQLFPKLMTE